ncbi:MAG TPA: MoxR family ATPase [Phycisphaerae bacterium]|nr:MoxR family ATPase [Phycisphaerae bacterium]
MKTELAETDVQLVERLAELYGRLVAEVRKRVVGQSDAVEQLVICALARGHGLLVGVPGLAKTLLVRTLADAMELTFRRIQFTPDLMPSDILGTEVIQEDPKSRQRQFRFLPGPVFAHLVLADEINRTPPKTQAALLETMQERQVSSGGITYPLEEPFLVMATQNPIEHEGTYPLPEAQLDRFLMEIRIGYPSAEDEIEIMERHSGQAEDAVSPILTRQDILACQSLVRRVPIGRPVLSYAANLIRRTRPEEQTALPCVRDGVSWGASPRAAMHLVLAAKARAVLHGQFAVGWDDIEAVLTPVLRHRLILNFAAQSEGLTPDRIIEHLRADTPRTTGGS